MNGGCVTSIGWNSGVQLQASLLSSNPSNRREQIQEVGCSHHSFPTAFMHTHTQYISLFQTRELKGTGFFPFSVCCGVC